MTAPLDLRVLVAGAGAVGSTLALALARAGARVTLADPARLGDNASGVAAGMIAPAFEALLDEAAPPLALMIEARDRWLALAGSIGLDLERSGALGVGPSCDLDAWEGRLATLDVAARRLSSTETASLAPWLRPGFRGLWTGEDWRLAPLGALQALKAAGEVAGLGRVASEVVAFTPGRAEFVDGTVIGADALVIATGASDSLGHLAPELAVLQPIKGHILSLATQGVAGPVVRLSGGYVCPSAGGALVGATMEAGRADRAIDPSAFAGLRRLGTDLSEALETAPFEARAGVRAATPDGLPLAGSGSAPGVWLAVGARRNGWLLAPLIAEVIVQSLAGAPATGSRNPFDPARFGR